MNRKVSSLDLKTDKFPQSTYLSWQVSGGRANRVEGSPVICRRASSLDDLDDPNESSVTYLISN